MCVCVCAGNGMERWWYLGAVERRELVEALREAHVERNGMEWYHLPPPPSLQPRRPPLSSSRRVVVVGSSIHRRAPPRAASYRRRPPAWVRVTQHKREGTP